MSIRIFLEANEMRRIRTFESGVVYKVISKTSPGEWYLDPIDTTTPDDGANVIVNPAGQRLKKSFFGSSVGIYDGTLLPPVYLHDIYTGPAVSYSMFKERTAYSGPCIRVRRTSDSAEQDIGFFRGALDVAALLSFIGSSSGRVATWYDQSGNANDAVQTVPSQQPRIVNAGVVDTTDGFVNIIFDGITQFLQASAVFSGAASRNLFAVYQPTRITGTDPIAGHGGSASNGQWFQLQSRDEFSAIGDPYLAGFAADVTDGVAPTLTRKIASVQYDGTDVKLYRNNVEIASAARSLNTTGVFYIGYNQSPSYTQAKILQVLAWAGSDQNGNRDNITKKINSRYSIF